MHVIAAKAVAFKQAMQPEFKDYQRRVISNAKCLAGELAKKGYRIVSGGTDNHLLLVDLAPRNITGKDAAEALDRARITVNKNLIPFDLKPPTVASGIRLGSPSITSRGMGTDEVIKICSLIDRVLTSLGDEKTVETVKKEVEELTDQFPLYESIREEMKKRID